jgi:uncharacterized protein (TIGR00251 family)
MMGRKDCQLLQVKVQTNAKKQKIMKLENGSYKLWVLSPPEKGRANKEAVSLLSEYLDLPRTRFKIIRGHGSPHKVLGIDKRET